MWTDSKASVLCSCAEQIESEAGVCLTGDKALIHTLYDFQPHVTHTREVHLLP